MLPVISLNVMQMLSKGHFIHFHKNIDVNKTTLLHHYKDTLRLLSHYLYVTWQA